VTRRGQREYILMTRSMASRQTRQTQSFPISKNAARSRASSGHQGTRHQDPDRPVEAALKS
jgi:hypothetical protein